MPTATMRRKLREVEPSMRPAETKSVATLAAHTENDNSFQFQNLWDWGKLTDEEHGFCSPFCPMPTPQETFTLQMRKVCEEHGVPTTRVGEAVHVLLGSHFQPALTLPTEAPALWRTRTSEDRDLNPIEFFQKHWGAYQEAGVLFQADLIRLDKPLYAAIERFCRYRGLDAKDYLPLPSRSKHGTGQSESLAR